MTVTEEPTGASANLRVFIHSNERQWLGALVAAHALRRNSRRRDAVAVEFIRLKEHPFLAAREGQQFPRGGTTRIWCTDDLQSFTPLRFLAPELAGHQGRAVVIDPDVFADGDVCELLTRDSQGAAVMGRHCCGRDDKQAQLASSVMLLDCAQLQHWDCEREFGELFEFKRVYKDWMGLAHEPPERKFGCRRRAGQAPHDRYSLKYTPDTPVPQPWQQFIAELRGDGYRKQIMRIFGCGRSSFRFLWHYTPTGCSVSPRCDPRPEYCSHLFYCNHTDDRWPEWSSGTLILDDGVRLNCDTAPALEEFVGVEEAPTIGDQSSLKQRSDHAWHAVRPIDCPEDRLRRIFIVVMIPNTIYWRVRDRLVGKQVQRL